MEPTTLGKWHGASVDAPKQAQYFLYCSDGPRVKYFSTEAAANRAFDRLSDVMQRVTSVERVMDERSQLCPGVSTQDRHRRG